MFLIEFEDLIYLHDQIIEASGGAKGIRDENAIKSAVGRPHQTAFGQEIHDDLFKKAAALLDSIANNHGFIDGNKRTAMATASFFLFAHNIRLSITDKQYEEFMLRVVNEKPPIDTIKTWLAQHSHIIVPEAGKF